MKNKVTLLNITASIAVQIASIISGLITPRIILSCFGSEVNGLVASINQFLVYIVLVEGGITGVISANLYKPLIENDHEKLSAIMVTARAFYKKIGYIFIAYSAIVGLVYPRIVDTGFSNAYVFALTMVLSGMLLLQYMFSLTYTTLLNADKKVYIDGFISAVTTLANIGLIYLVTVIYPDIILLRIACVFLDIFKPLIFSAYIKKHYRINWKQEKDNNLIVDRWSGFAINLAFYIHAGTDVVVLTFLSDLKTVSVYNVYALIINKINALIQSIASGINPTLGQAYAKNDLKELHEKLDLYEYVIFFLVGFLFTMTGLLITPFVMIYTHGINDADYFQPVFGVLLVLAEALCLLKEPHVSLAYSANKFKELTAPAYIEAAINLCVSILLVRKIGLIGVAIGTILGMLYRMIFQVYYTSKLIPDRKQSIFYKKLAGITGVTLIGIGICSILFPIREFEILNWIAHAIGYGGVFAVLYILFSFGFFKKELVYFHNYLKRK